MADSVYLISQPNGTYINISFISMDINCQDIFSTSDYIEIRDGNTKDSPLMEKFCGNGSNVWAYVKYQGPGTPAAYFRYDRNVCRRQREMNTLVPVCSRFVKKNASSIDEFKEATTFISTQNYIWIR